jgi:glycosyltransferase involved in cell wall biosynthesis
VSAGRVLHVLQPDDGGVRAHVSEVARGLRRRGWEVEVAASQSAGPGSPFRRGLEAAGVVVHALPLRRAPGRDDVAAARGLRRLDATHRYDVVHAHSSKAGALVRLALPRRRRLVYTPHCFAFAAALGPARAAYWAVEQALLARSGAVVACSEWERRLALRRLAGASRVVRRIRNGVPPCRAVEVHPALAAAPRPVAGFLARLEPQKDPLALVRAAAAHPGTVAIVGSGSLEDAVDREIAALGPAARVLRLPFEGPVERYLRGFDLYVLPSRWESLPIAVLEAMACGLPVLATDVGGTAEAVRDGVTGRLVAPGDSGALARALAQMSADPEALRRMGEAGRELAAGELSAERMVDDLETLYRALVAR